MRSGLRSRGSSADGRCVGHHSIPGARNLHCRGRRGYPIHRHPARPAGQGYAKGNRLIASHKTERDIILRDAFEAMEGLETLWTVTGDNSSKLAAERVDKAFLSKHVTDLDQRFYLCGPDAMVSDLREALEALGADVSSVTWEK
jgi:ferredoxin-NADP reductase